MTLKLPDTAVLPIPCPKCGHKTDQTFGRIKASRKYTCRCGTVVNVNADKLAGDLAAAEQMIREKFKK
jgi:hypothetical protein